MAVSWPCAVRFREIVIGSFCDGIFCLPGSFCGIVEHEKNRTKIIIKENVGKKVLLNLMICLFLGNVSFIVWKRQCLFENCTFLVFERFVVLKKLFMF